MKKIFGIIVIFLLSPYLLDKYLMDKVVTTMNKSEWFGFLGSYLGGGITALITLFGIYWQLNETKEKEQSGIIKFIEYKFRKNIVLQFPYDIFKNNLETKIEKILYDFDKSFIDQNINIIFSLNKGEVIAELIERIGNYNRIYLEFSNKYNKINFKELGIFINKVELSDETKVFFKNIIREWLELSLLIELHKKKIDIFYKYQNSRIENSDFNELNKSFETITQNLKVDLKKALKIDFENERKKVIKKYMNLLNQKNILRKNFGSIEYEEYLIKKFELEKDIYIESVGKIIKNVNISEANSILEISENHLDCINLKIWLIKEKNIILEEIKVVLKNQKELNRIKS